MATIDQMTIDAFLTVIKPGEVFSYRDVQDRDPGNYAVMFIKSKGSYVDPYTMKGQSLVFWVMPGQDNEKEGGVFDVAASSLIEALMNKDTEMASIISPENML